VPDLAVWTQIVRPVARVDDVLVHELIDLDGSRRLQRDLLELLLRDLDELVLVELLCLHNGHFVAGVRIDLGVFDAVASRVAHRIADETGRRVTVRHGERNWLLYRPSLSLKAKAVRPRAGSSAGNGS
jgi:hypothetical protein